MQESQKLSKFLDAIHKEATARRDKITGETEELKRSELKEAEEQALKGIYSIIVGEEEELHLESGRLLSEYLQENKKRLLEFREKLMQDVFLEVKHRLLVFCVTDNYLKKIEKDIEQVKDCLSGEVIVKMKPADRAESVVSKYNLTNIEQDSKIEIGGIVIFLKDQKKIYDFTFDKMMNSEKEWFRENSAMSVN